MPSSDRNKTLAEYLQETGYLTSWEEKDEKYFDSAVDCEKTKKVLKLRVRKVR